MRIGDFDGDGRSDLLKQRPSGVFSYMAGADASWVDLGASGVPLSDNARESSGRPVGSGYRVGVRHAGALTSVAIIEYTVLCSTVQRHQREPTLGGTMLWVIVILVLVAGVLIVRAIASNDPGRIASPGSESGGTAPALPHSRTRPSLDALSEALNAAPASPETDLVKFSRIASEVYESWRHRVGFDLYELEDYADRVCSTLVDLRPQDPKYADVEINEWIDVVVGTARHNGGNATGAFHDKWQKRS